MNKFISIGGAVALALTMSLSAVTPSSADSTGAAIAGGVLGFMAGAAAANGLGPNYHYNDSDYGRWRSYGGRWGYGDDFRWRQHVRDCFRVYGSAYDPRTDSYVGRHGQWRRCRV